MERAARRPQRPRLLARLGAAALALAFAAPVAATVWSRSIETVRLPKGGRAELSDVLYTARDWKASITAVEVKPAPEPPGSRGETASVWTFHYTNTAHEPRYVLVNVRCLDDLRKERAGFKATLTLLADRPSGGKADVTFRAREADWRASSTVKVVVDFLSGPEG